LARLRVAGRLIGGGVGLAVGCSRPRQVERETAAAVNAQVLAVALVLRGAAGVGGVGAIYPLARVAGHVLRAVGAGAVRELSHLRGPLGADVGARLILRVAPRPPPIALRRSIPGRCLLPLLLGGQALARPVGVSDGIVVADAHHGLARVLLKVVWQRRVVDRLGVAGLFAEARVLLVGHFVLIDEKSGS